jgi:hypothetical protein
MIVEHLLDISSNEDLIFEFNDDEIEVRVDVDITSWDRDFFNHSFIEDYEVMGVKVFDVDGKWHEKEFDSEIAQNILALLENNDRFDDEVQLTSEEDEQSRLVEQQVERMEERKYEMLELGWR